LLTAYMKDPLNIILIGYSLDATKAGECLVAAYSIQMKYDSKIINNNKFYDFLIDRSISVSFNFIKEVPLTAEVSVYD
ncbi:hypothetical protein, partial [Faecalicatena contorta]|uniref:hypothetical protein n=1 Tax=Faecalicatena contorta TaxID=39482 RepID=UPI00195FD8CC